MDRDITALNRQMETVTITIRDTDIPDPEVGRAGAVNLVIKNESSIVCYDLFLMPQDAVNFQAAINAALRDLRHPNR